MAKILELQLQLLLFAGPQTSGMLLTLGICSGLSLGLNGSSTIHSCGLSFNFFAQMSPQWHDLTSVRSSLISFLKVEPLNTSSSFFFLYIYPYLINCIFLCLFYHLPPHTEIQALWGWSVLSVLFTTISQLLGYNVQYRLNKYLLYNDE